MLVKLNNVCDIVAGFAFKSNDFNTTGFDVVKISEIKPPIVDLSSCSKVNLDLYDKSRLSKYIVSRNDFVIAMTGATIGKIGRVLNDTAYINQRVAKFNPKDNIDKKYLYYVLSTSNFANFIESNIDSHSAQPNISAGSIGRYEFNCHNQVLQRHIINILGSLDDKIENNEKIIESLNKFLLYKYKLLTNYMANYTTTKMEEIFDVSIGRTPPRKETQWFTKCDQGKKWVSIADMGNSNVYISKTNESLTEEAVKKFNIPIIPKNTLILSFKLTVGRIAITNEDMLSNEAIAHFKTDNIKIIPYLYAYLKHFDFNKLGNTSSIANATNSKSVKNMEFVLPNNDFIESFYKQTNPLLDGIRSKLLENDELITLKNLYLKQFFK